MTLLVRPAVGPSATVLARSALPPAEVMPLVAEFPLTVMFVRWAIFPGVVRVDGQKGTWDRVGGSRTLRLTDRGTMLETLIEHVPGRSFAYEITRITDPFRLLVRGVRGEWSFAPDGEGTVVRWTWEFAPQVGRRGVVAAVVVPLWRAHMGRMIRLLVTRIGT